VKQGNFQYSAYLCATKSWKLCWNAWEPQSICCRAHTNITHISAGVGFWTYIDWDVCTHLSEYCTPLKHVTHYLNILYIEASCNCGVEELRYRRWLVSILWCLWRFFKFKYELKLCWLSYWLELRISYLNKIS
jgi:hypothetical protein